MQKLIHSRHTQKPVVIHLTQNLDAIRYISYSLFLDFLNTLKSWSEQQFFYLLLGITGFRPFDLLKLTTGHLFFNRPTPIIVNHIGKPRKKYYFSCGCNHWERGLRQYWEKVNPKKNHPNQTLQCPIHLKATIRATKIINKVKEREIPQWVVLYVFEYLKRNAHKLTVRDEQGNYYLFPCHRTNQPRKTQYWEVDINKQRKHLIKLDEQKWGWVMEIAHPRYFAKKGWTDGIHRLSLYTLRHSRLTWKAMEYLEKGLNDVSLLVSKWVGHELAATTHGYIESVITKPFKAPNLNIGVFQKDRSQQINLKEFI